MFDSSLIHLQRAAQVEQGTLLLDADRIRYDIAGTLQKLTDRHALDPYLNVRCMCILVEFEPKLKEMCHFLLNFTS